MTKSIYQPTPEWEEFKIQCTARALARKHLKENIKHVGKALLYGMTFCIWYISLCALLA